MASVTHKGDAAGDPRPRAAPSRDRTACSRWARCRAPTGLGLEEAGVALDEGGLVRVDRVSRTWSAGCTPRVTAPGV